MAAAVNPSETWFPITPPPSGHLDHAPSKEIGVDATPLQSEGKEDGSKEKVEICKEDGSKEKVDIKKVRKKRGPKGRILLDATFERTPKRRTPNPKTPKPKTPKPKTPKPTKLKRDVPLEPKTKNTKRKLSMIAEEILTLTNTGDDLSEVTVVNNETPTITESSYRRSNLNEFTSSKRINLNVPVKRVLDLNLDCQLDDENSSDLVPQICAPESSSGGTSFLNMCRGGSLQLRCRCCSCRIGKVKLQFPKECNRLRTVLRVAKARRRRLLPTKMSREAIEKFFNCTMLLTQMANTAVKRRTVNRRKARTNWYLNETIQAQQAPRLLQQSNIPGLDHSAGGEDTQIISFEQQASLVNTVKEKVTKVKKEKVAKVKKEKVAKERKKKKKKLAWDEHSSIEEMVEYITTRFQESLVIPSLYEIHKETKLEALVDEESKRVFLLLKDKEDDNYDAKKEADEEKQRWWDEQRKNLCMKVAFFVSEMQNFLGNRSFSPWKGSIVDSVVGVYLTQNVSDTLSSTAFMHMVAKYPVKPPREDTQLCIEYRTSSNETNSEIPPSPESVASSSPPAHCTDSPERSVAVVTVSNLDAKKEKMEEGKGKGEEDVNWDELRTTYSRQSHGKQRSPDRADSVDWDAVRNAHVPEIAQVIECRGQHFILAAKIKSFLNRILEKHGSIDLEWLRDVPPLKAKEFLLSIHGIGLKSVECLRLLTLHHHAFPVDVNVGRIAVRLGWVPLQDLPDDIQFHILANYPTMDAIQEYLWPRLSHLSQEMLYELHYLLITFGKVFCTKVNPHCGACPLREDCKYYASKRNSSIPSLAWLRHEEAKKDLKKLRNPFKDGKPSSLVIPPRFPELRFVDRLKPYNDGKPSLVAIGPIFQRFPELRFVDRKPVIEEPSSPEPQLPPEQEKDIEDLFTVDEDEDPEYIPVLDLRSQPHETSTAIVTLSPEVASNASPQLKFIARMRTEHQVYEVRDDHPLLEGLPRREKDDKCFYLIAIWPQGADGSSQANDKTVPGTLLIPVRTAMKGSFPLNGTYFQVNEVFVDHETSKRPIDVPRDLLWDLPKKTLYCGTSTTSILKGLTMEHIQNCFQNGYLCTRALKRKNSKPKMLPAIFHQRLKSTPKKKKEEDKA